MNRKEYMIYKFIAAVLLMSSLISSASDRPNIVVFIVDDMGVMDTSVPFYCDDEGNPQEQKQNGFYRTPAMNSLAETGVRFSRFYANSVCSPSRASLLSGQYSARHKVTQWIKPSGKNAGPENWNWEGARPGDVSLQSSLKQAGYTTIHIGKAHLGPVGHIGSDPLKLGFDVNIGGHAAGLPKSYYGEKSYGKGDKLRAVPHLEKYHGTDTFLTEALTLEAKAALTKANTAGKPFFLHMSHYAVHAPFQADPRFVDNYKDSGKGKQVKAFATLVEGMDKSLGDIVAHLKQIGQAENTLIIFLGDNGSDSPLAKNSAPYRGKKGTCYEGGMLAPLMISWAAPSETSEIQKKFPIKPGIVSPDFVTICDLMPTVLKVTDVAKPNDHVFDGQELTTYMASHKGSHSQEFLMHFPHRHNSSNYTVFRKDQWKLIRFYEDDAKLAKVQLFNVKEDVSESNNLAVEMPQKLKEMGLLMDQKLKDSEAQYWQK